MNATGILVCLAKTFSVKMVRAWKNGPSVQFKDLNIIWRVVFSAFCSSLFCTRAASRLPGPVGCACLFIGSIGYLLNLWNRPALTQKSVSITTSLVHRYFNVKVHVYEAIDY